MLLYYTIIDDCGIITHKHVLVIGKKSFSVAAIISAHNRYDIHYFCTSN